MLKEGQVKANFPLWEEHYWGLSLGCFSKILLDITLPEINTTTSWKKGRGERKRNNKKRKGLQSIYFFAKDFMCLKSHNSWWMILCNTFHLELKCLSFSKVDKERTFGHLYNMFLEYAIFWFQQKIHRNPYFFCYHLFFLVCMKYDKFNVKLVALWTFPLGLPIKKWYKYFQIWIGLILACVCVNI